jgi:hypothetical protein
LAVGVVVPVVDDEEFVVDDLSVLGFDSDLVSEEEDDELDEELFARLSVR